MVYVLADSLLNQLDQEKLSRKYEVIVQCSEFVLLHVGTNDCTTKTSCEVKKELENRLNNIQSKLPTTKLISMFDFHPSNRGSNPSRGGKIS